ncbi:MAG TPA: selenocysteine-specific translation elongation factor [Vicinamibacterales bacterium]|nr:selenocysteine-specific translation elongation factor [Vicinamibacterales bacterium]
MNSIVIGTAGHIDHGKSALVKALTGTDPDRLKEEQARGITIDLGFAQFTHGTTRIAFVDVPGHERFVRNMLAGASGIDAVLLVVDVNESVRPQTREHFQICRLLGLDRGVIALTKTDVAGAAAVAHARSEVQHLVAGSFLEDASMVEVSATKGHGLNELSAAIAALAGRPPRQQREGIARLPIDRAFTIRGFGAVVTGTLVSGRIAEGDTLTILPDSRSARVRGVQVDGEKVARAEAPQRVAVNLADIETRDLRRGQTLASESALTTSNRADVELELIAGVPPLRHGARVRIHAGSGETNARVSIAATRQRASAEWMPVRPGDSRVEVAAGAVAFARLRFESPVVLTRGDRLILRAGSPLTTVAGASVLDPEPPVAGLRRDAALERFQQLARPDPPINLVLQERGEVGIGVRDLVRRCGLDQAGAAEAFEGAIAGGAAVRVADRAVDAEVVSRWEALVVSALEEFHRSHPLDPGLSPGAIRGRGGHAPPELVAVVLQRLAARGLVRGKDRVALASHTPTASTAEQELHGRLEHVLRDGALSPPDAAELAVLLGVRTQDVDRAIQWLLREKRIIRTGGLLFHQDALGALKSAVRSQRVGQAADARVTFDVPTFKSRFGLTRKHAIPLLEWLDRERVTRRAGDVRVVL